MLLDPTNQLGEMNQEGMSLKMVNSKNYKDICNYCDFKYIIIFFKLIFAVHDFAKNRFLQQILPFIIIIYLKSL